jgi:hypothetical protein
MRKDMNSAIGTVSEWRKLELPLDISESVRLLTSRVELLQDFKQSGRYDLAKYTAQFVIDTAQRIPAQYLADAKFGHAIREIEMFAAECLALPDTLNVLDRSGEILSRKDIAPGPERFPVGSIVRVASLDKLLEFRKSWKFHHPIQGPQLEYAGALTRVDRVGYYHGGDVLYQLENCGPWDWHEACVTEP